MLIIMLNNDKKRESMYHEHKNQRGEKDAQSLTLELSNGMVIGQRRID